MARTAELRSTIEKLQAELAERSLVELALRESEARFHDLADTAPVGIWLTNSDKRVSFLNKTALAFADKPPEDLLGNAWAKLLHPDDVDQVFSTFASAVEKRDRFRIECRLQRADGEYRWMLNTGIPRFVDDLYVGHIGTISDTTELKRSHEQLLANQKLESLGVLAAGIAHDFNNVLGAIFAESDLALTEVPDGTPAGESIQRIKAVAVRASEIVKLLLAYAGATDVAKEHVDLSELADEMVQLLRNSISRKAKLHTSLAKGLPRLFVNPSQIRQVLFNLIINASEALEECEGLIEVSTSHVHLTDEMARSYGSGRQPGDYALLTVKDNGCGITEDMRTKIFDPFYTTKFLGRGLGLAVVQGILRSHQGDIKMLTAPGTGSTFEVILPCGSTPAP